MDKQSALSRQKKIERIKTWMKNEMEEIEQSNNNNYVFFTSSGQN